MSDDTPTPDPYSQRHSQRAAYLAAMPEATWEHVMAEGAGVRAAIIRDFPERAQALEQADARWKRAGKPAAMVRTSPPATVPTPRPEPVPVPVTVPDPAEIKSIRDLLARGPLALHAFKEAHPAEFAALPTSSPRQ